MAQVLGTPGGFSLSSCPGGVGWAVHLSETGCRRAGVGARLPALGGTEVQAVPCRTSRAPERLRGEASTAPANPCEAPLHRSCSLTWQGQGAPPDHNATAAPSVPDQDPGVLTSRLHRTLALGLCQWLAEGGSASLPSSDRMPACCPCSAHRALCHSGGPDITRAGEWAVDDVSHQMTCQTQREPSRATSEKTGVQRGGRPRAQGRPAPHLLPRTEFCWHSRTLVCARAGWTGQDRNKSACAVRRQRPQELPGSDGKSLHSDWQSHRSAEPTCPVLAPEGPPLRDTGNHRPAVRGKI